MPDVTVLFKGFGMVFTSILVSKSLKTNKARLSLRLFRVRATSHLVEFKSILAVMLWS